MNLPKKMTVESPRSLSVIGIIREALTIPSRSWKLSVSIMLLVFVPISLLTLASDLYITPVVRDLNSKIALLPKVDPSSPQANEIANAIQKDIRILVGLEALFLIAFFIIALFSLIATVYSSAMAYTRNHLTLKGLFSTIGGTWKRPMITWFYVCLISIAYSLLILVLIGVCMVFAQRVVLIGLIVLVTLVGVLFYVYLTVVWLLGLVISIVEDGCYGLMALERAGELIKGRRFQGFVLMLLLSVLTVTIPIAFSIKMGGIEQNTAARLAIGIVMICLVCLVKLFIFVVYTVFYFDCVAYNEEIQFGQAVVYALTTSEV